MFSNNGGGLQMSQIPFIGGMFPNPNEAAMRDAMTAAGQAYANMRPQQAQGYQNIMSQVQNQMAPASQALANMYGGQHGQNSDVTAAIAAQNPRDSGAAQGALAGLSGPRPSDNSGKGQSGNDPLGGFLTTLDPVGGLSSIGGSFGGLFDLDGGGGGPMNALKGGMGGMSGGGLLGGLLGGGGGLGGILGGGGGGGMPGLGGMFGLG
jgi:hypothetical protein